MPKLDHISIPMAEDFMDDDYELELTQKSIDAFKLGRPKQGFVGLIEFLSVDERTPEGKIRARIHLLPANNADSGTPYALDSKGRKYAVDKNGDKYSTIESAQPLGSFSGDVHMKAASVLALGHKAGVKGQLMGFGIWKSGCGIKMLDHIPNKEALIPNEYLLVKEKGRWALYSTFIRNDESQNCDYTQIDIDTIPGLQEALNELPDKDPEKITYDERLKVEKILQSTDFAKKEAKDSIGVVKNRSSSQNMHSIKRDSFLTTYLKLATDNHSAHSVNIPREIPYPILEKITNSMMQQLGLPVFPDLLDANVIPGGISGPRSHLKLERKFLSKEEQERKTEFLMAAITNDSAHDIKVLIEKFNGNISEMLGNELSLLLSVQTHNLNAAKAILENIKSVSPEKYDALLSFALKHFIRKNNLDAIDFILENSSKVTNLNVIEAISSGNVSIVEKIFQYSSKIENENTADFLSTAIFGDHGAVVKYLIENLNVQPREILGNENSLIEATKYCHFNAAAVLVENIKLKEPENYNVILSNVLSHAIRHNMTDVANFALWYGAKIDNNVILETIQTGSIPMLELLLHYGAKLDSPYLLLSGIRSGNPDMINYLLYCGVKPNQLKEPGYSELHNATYCRSLAYIQILLNQKDNPVDLEERVEGVTVLSRAVFNNDIVLAQLFLEHKADPNCTEPDGTHVLTTAVKNGNLELVKLLLEAGANPNNIDQYGQTPLSYAHDDKITEVLIAASKKQTEKIQPSFDQSQETSGKNNLRASAVTFSSSQKVPVVPAEKTLTISEVKEKKNFPSKT